MISYLTFATALMLVLLVVMQISYVAIYLRRMALDGMPLACGSEEKNVDSANSRMAEREQVIAVVLCLRGADPSLPACLAGLAQQTLSNFHLHVVVDSPDDPAIEVVQPFLSQFGRVLIHTIEHRYRSCSLKCSAILTALKALPNTVTSIAFLDADTIPDSNWLAALLAPLADPQIGATTGNRWFDSPDPDLGTAVRQVWNAAAIVQMSIYNIVWGGSFAIKRDLLESTALLERWQNSFCEDTLIADELQRHGLQVKRVHGLICVNREPTRFADAVAWITRQLLTIRLHHSKWRLVQAHAAGILFCSAALALGLASALSGNLTAALVALSVILAYQVTNAVLLMMIETTHWKILERCGNPRPAQRSPWLSGNRWLAILLSQLVFPWACAAATWGRRIRWRGIEYRIHSAGTIEMGAYRPFRETARPPEPRRDQSHSLN